MVAVVFGGRRASLRSGVSLTRYLFASAVCWGVLLAYAQDDEDDRVPAPDSPRVMGLGGGLFACILFALLSLILFWASLCQEGAARCGMCIGSFALTLIVVLFSTLAPKESRWVAANQKSMLSEEFDFSVRVRAVFTALLALATILGGLGYVVHHAAVLTPARRVPEGRTDKFGVRHADSVK